MAVAQTDVARPGEQPARTRARTLARRAVVIGTPALYLIALAITIDRWGLPVARDQLFFWLALGMAAFSVARWRSWGRLALEWAPFFGLLVLYDLLRGAVAVSADQAHQTTQIDVDRFLFGHQIPSVWLQRHLWDGVGHLHWYDYLTWATYMTHFFAVWVTAAVVWRVAHDRFRQYAVIVILLTLGAFLTYWLFPAQPPWLAAQSTDIGHMDRVVPEVWGKLGVGTIKSVYENSDFVNPVAAMPSLHAAYPCMLLLVFWWAGWKVRIPLALYTLMMGTALVYGGEHYVMDVLAGWLMAGAAVATVKLAAPAAYRVTKRAMPFAMPRATLRR